MEPAPNLNARPGVGVLAFREDDAEIVKAIARSPKRLSVAMSQRSDAVRITNDCVASVAIADPVNRSQSTPICGSSEKLIATMACGLTKCIRIKVMSLSPSTVVDIDVLALGARIMARIQTLLPVAAAIRVDVATTPP